MNINTVGSNKQISKTSFFHPFADQRYLNVHELAIWAITQNTLQHKQQGPKHIAHKGDYYPLLTHFNPNKGFMERVWYKDIPGKSARDYKLPPECPVCGFEEYPELAFAHVDDRAYASHAQCKSDPLYMFEYVLPRTQARRQKNMWIERSLTEKLSFDVHRIDPGFRIYPGVRNLYYQKEFAKGNNQLLILR